jgi:integrase
LLDTRNSHVEPPLGIDGEAQFYSPLCGEICGETVTGNPIEEVRQSAESEHEPETLTLEEIKTLLSELEQPFLALVALDAVTGLRRSELLALQWADIDFQKLQINLRRAVVRQVVGGMKTLASRKPVPMQPELAELLLDLRSRTPYNQPQDWVFASTAKRGLQPFWPENLLRRYIRPAAVRAGIQKRIGFHTFRHSLGTVMNANGENINTVKDILRHANSRTTARFYIHTVERANRDAQQKVLQVVLPSLAVAEGR